MHGVQHKNNHVLSSVPTWVDDALIFTEKRSPTDHGGVPSLFTAPQPLLLPQAPVMPLNKVFLRQQGQVWVGLWLDVYHEPPSDMWAVAKVTKYDSVQALHELYYPDSHEIEDVVLSQIKFRLKPTTTTQTTPRASTIPKIKKVTLQAKPQASVILHSEAKKTSKPIAHPSLANQAESNGIGVTDEIAEYGDDLQNVQVQLVNTTAKISSLVNMALHVERSKQLQRIETDVPKHQSDGERVSIGEKLQKIISAGKGINMSEVGTNNLIQKVMKLISENKGGSEDANDEASENKETDAGGKEVVEENEAEMIKMETAARSRREAAEKKSEEQAWVRREIQVALATIRNRTRPEPANILSAAVADEEEVASLEDAYRSEDEADKAAGFVKVWEKPPVAKGRFADQEGGRRPNEVAQAEERELLLMLAKQFSFRLTLTGPSRK
jgi:hypothetical protein